MNNLLLLAGIVLVVCLMNSKDLMKSVSSKSKSVSKSLVVDSSTLLVVVFVGAVLFMCMNKVVEGYSELEAGKCSGETPHKHILQVLDDNDKPLFNPIKLCLNDDEQKRFTKNGKVANLSTTTNPSSTVSDGNIVSNNNTSMNNSQPSSEESNTEGTPTMSRS